MMLDNSTVLFLWVSCSTKNLTCFHCFNPPNNCTGRYYYYPTERLSDLTKVTKAGGAYLDLNSEPGSTLLTGLSPIWGQHHDLMVLTHKPPEVALLGSLGPKEGNGLPGNHLPGHSKLRAFLQTRPGAWRTLQTSSL